MTYAPTLFDNVRPSDPPTSHAAARINRTTLTEQVRAALTEHPEGLTDWELCQVLGFELVRKPSVGKRRQELGAIDSGRTRLSPFDSPCTVWRLP